jgi:hypothetical protein
MTLISNFAPERQQGNGNTKEFSYRFNALEEENIAVYIEKDGVQTPYYNFTATVSDEGGIVTLDKAPSADEWVVINRETEPEQDIPYSTSSGFDAQVVEGCFDKDMAVIQEMKNSLTRTPKLPIGYNVDLTLEAPSPGKAIAWNDEGTGFVNSTLNLDTAESLIKGYRDTAVASANSAKASETNALNSIKQANDLLNETTQYVTDQKNEISTLTTESVATVTDARDTAINTIDSAVADAKSTIDTYVQAGEDMIDTTANDAKTDINTTVADAKNELSSTIESAIEDVKAEGVKAAKDAIQDVTDSAEQAKEDADRAETAANKAESIATNLSSATETTEGIIRLATETEALEGFDNSTAITPLTASKIAYDNVGRVIQLSFNGTLSDDVITFTPTEGEAYDIRQGYEYEIDLLLEAVGDIDNPSMVLLNGTKAITILNAIHTDSTALLNTDDMAQVMEYSTDVGYRWIFRAKYVELESGSKVFYMERPVVNIKSAPDVDGETVVINSDEQLQAVGVIDTGTTTARKFWSGTQKEYNEQIKVPDANTQYDITDDFTAAVYEAYSKSETNSLLDNKADTELANLTNTAKESIVSWGMPDYTAGVSVAVGATVTATVDSVYMGYCSVSTSGGKTSISVKLYDENGEQITEAGNRYITSSGTASFASASIPVPKGYAIKLETGENLKYSVLYPLKGVSNA